MFIVSASISDVIINTECIIGMKEPVTLSCFSKDAHFYIWDHDSATVNTNTTVGGRSILTFRCDPEYDGVYSCFKTYQEVSTHVVSYNLTAVERSTLNTEKN